MNSATSSVIVVWRNSPSARQFLTRYEGLRGVPRIAQSPLIEQMAGGRVWYEYIDSATDELLYRRLEGQGPALNTNAPAASRGLGDHLALVHDRDAQTSGHEAHHGRKR